MKIWERKTYRVLLWVNFLRIISTPYPFPSELSHSETILFIIFTAKYTIVNKCRKYFKKLRDLKENCGIRKLIEILGQFLENVGKIHGSSKEI